MSDPTMLLAVSQITKTYGETIALNDVSIDFQPGTVHTILGENGSGKSTLVKLLSGIVDRDSGTLSFKGTPFPGRGPAAFKAAGFATVFQEVLVAPDRSVAENVLLGMDGLFSWGIAPARRRQAVRAVFDRIATTPVDIDAQAGSLPLAQQQLVVIARALVRNPQILILDEATAALDHADRESVFRQVEAMARAGQLVIFISHRMDEVLRLSDRLSILRNGQLVRTLARGEATAEALLALMAPAHLQGAEHA